MKKFFVKIIILSIIPVLAILLVGLRQEQDRIVTKKRQLFEQYKGNVQCLIMGTSHTLNGINPTLLPVKTLNIGETGKPAELDMAIIEKNLKQLPKLKYVIFPVDYFTFYFTGLHEEDAVKLYHHWNIKNGFIKSFHLKRYHAFTCGFLLNEHKNLDRYDASMGYQAEFADFSKADRNYRIRKYQRKITDWNRYLIDTGSSQQIFNSFVDFISKLEEKQIKTILVTMPVCQQFYDFLDTNLLTKNKQLIDGLLHHTNATYINLQGNPSMVADSLFFNIDHLNDKGATIATNIINAAMLSDL